MGFKDPQFLSTILYSTRKTWLTSRISVFLLTCLQWVFQIHKLWTGNQLGKAFLSSPPPFTVKVNVFWLTCQFTIMVIFSVSFSWKCTKILKWNCIISMICVHGKLNLMLLKQRCLKTIWVGHLTHINNNWLHRWVWRLYALHKLYIHFPGGLLCQERFVKKVPRVL